MNMEAVQNLKFEVKCVFFKLFKQMTAFQLVRFLGLPGTAHTYIHSVLQWNFCIFCVIEIVILCNLRVISLFKLKRVESFLKLIRFPTVDSI
jgi:hypothetical protein